MNNLSFKQVQAAVEACLDPQNDCGWDEEGAKAYREMTATISDKPFLWLGRMQAIWLIMTAGQHANLDAGLVEWRRVLCKVQSGAVTWDEFVDALAAGKPPRAPKEEGN